MRDVDIGIAPRFAPTVDVLFPRLVVISVKEFRLREAVDFSIVRIGQRIFGNAFFSTVICLDLLFAVLDDTLEFTFANDRIFRIVFRLHDGLDVLVFLRSEEFIRNLETRPELITDTGFHGKVTAFGNLDRILDSARDIPEQFHHLFLGAEIELFRRETLVFKTVQRDLKRDAAQNLVRCGIFGLDVMDIAHGNDFTTVLFRKFHVKLVHVLLLRNPVIANRNVQVVVVKNLV